MDLVVQIAILALQERSSQGSCDEASPDSPDWSKAGAERSTPSGAFPVDDRGSIDARVSL